MKQLLLQAIACCAVLLPFSQADAKTYGGLKPGQTFTFTVNYKVSSKTVGLVTKQDVAVPAGVPNFKLGSKVTFTVGPKGQLTAKGMSLPFKKVDTKTNPGRESNLYLLPPPTSSSYPYGDSGSLAKIGTSKPVGLSLTFNKTVVTAGKSAQHQVFYSLD